MVLKGHLINHSGSRLKTLTENYISLILYSPLALLSIVALQITLPPVLAGSFNMFIMLGYFEFNKQMRDRKIPQSLRLMIENQSMKKAEEIREKVKDLKIKNSETFRALTFILQPQLPFNALNEHRSFTPGFYCMVAGEDGDDDGEAHKQQHENIEESRRFYEGETPSFEELIEKADWIISQFPEVLRRIEKLEKEAGLNAGGSLS